MAGRNGKQGKNKGHENLKLGMWKPGQSGNPKGLAPGTKTAPARTFTEICRQYLSEPIAAGDDRTRAEVLATAMYAKGLKGDTRAASVILDRIDPALKRVEVSGVAADAGRGMLDRLLQATVLPVARFDSYAISIHSNGHSQNENGTNGKC